MTKQELLDMKPEKVLKFLNKNYKDKPEDILKLFDEKDKENFEGLCVECYGQTEQKRSGDEGVTWCESCQMTEGNTFEADVIEPLKVAYHYRNKCWIEKTDELGSEL